jgi:hypothetical protein
MEGGPAGAPDRLDPVATRKLPNETAKLTNLASD